MIILFSSTPKPFGSETKFSKDFRSNIKPSKGREVEEATEDILANTNITKSTQVRLIIVV